MICERCHGTGMVRELTDQPPFEVWEPCPDCGACGFAHCCEGEQGQPDVE